MTKHTHGFYSIVTCFILALLLVLLGGNLLEVQSVQAGNGTTVDIPASSIVPVMDGVCSPSEYSDATQVTVTVGTNLTFPVYMKRDASDAYFCFGDASGLPLPNGGASQVAVYIDPSDDGAAHQSNADDFGIWMPYDSTQSPWAETWGTGFFFNGTDPGGWKAVKHQILGSSPLWQVEFQISRETLGGWNHQVGIALFYHWWQKPSDDYSWPGNGIWASAQDYGNGRLLTGSVDVNVSAAVPTLDGQCGPEYSDASTVNFNTSSGVVNAYLKLSLTDLYVCLKNLAIPALAMQNKPNAALYIDRTGQDGGVPTANELVFTISYSGIVKVNSGDGVGYTGSDPGGHTITYSHHSGGWDAEFRISSSTIGNWRSRTIGLTLAEQSVSKLGDDYGWPTGYSKIVPASWGEANLKGLVSPPPLHLPLIFR